MSKTGKEIKLNSYNNYNIVFGSVNNKHPKAMYLSISAWAEPKMNIELNYNRIIKDLNKKIKQSLYNNFDLDNETDFIKDRSIIDLDIRESGIKYGKRSYMNCEITLFLKSEIPINSDKMQPIINKLIDSILNYSFDGNKNFSFHKRKK